MCSSCGGRRGDTVQSDVDSLTFSSLTTAVSTLISDSGITRYKLNAQEWYTYTAPQKWYFPEGIYVEQFDTLFNIQASIQADTAYYFQDKKLWKLIGNVEVLNRDSNQFYAYTLFWDQDNHTVYSNDSITIIRSDGQTIHAKYGFTGNEYMTKWRLLSSTGVLNVDESNDPLMAQPDSIDSDNDSIPLSRNDSN